MGTLADAHVGRCKQHEHMRVVGETDPEDPRRHQGVLMAHKNILEHQVQRTRRAHAQGVPVTVKAKTR